VQLHYSSFQAHGDDALCRHAILTILGETDTSPAGIAKAEALHNQCSVTEKRDIGAHAKIATRVVNTLLNLDEPCTMNQIVTKCKFSLIGFHGS
jgi:hypothetical protein